VPKQVVIYRGGWGFILPDQDVAKVSEDGQSIQLSTPDRGGTYTLERVDDSDPDELRIFVAPGGPSSGHSLRELPKEYPFPTINIELHRLRARWEAAGGSRGDDPGDRNGQLERQRLEASALGDSWDSRTERMRKMIRELGR
jgi:hypothetical protein